MTNIFFYYKGFSSVTLSDYKQNKNAPLMVNISVFFWRLYEILRHSITFNLYKSYVK